MEKSIKSSGIIKFISFIIIPIAIVLLTTFILIEQYKLYYSKCNNKESTVSKENNNTGDHSIIKNSTEENIEEQYIEKHIKEEHVEEHGPKFIVDNSPPAGFIEQENYIIYAKVFYKQINITTTRLRIEGDRYFTIIDYNKIIKKLPAIKSDKIDDVISKLKDKRIFNTEYSCYPIKRNKCDISATDSIDIFFDQETLGINIILNNDLFVKNENHEYINEKTSDFSNLSKLFIVGYWNKSKDYTNDSLYTVSVNSKTSYKKFTLNTDFYSTTSHNNVFFDNIKLSRYYKKSELSLGELETKNLQNLLQADLLGISLSTSLSRIKNDLNLYAQPIYIYLSYKSLVNLIVDGKIYHSAYYEFGNQEIDTSSLPFGSYNVKIEIIEPTGKKRTIDYFFVKNSLLAPSSIPYYWLDFGFLKKDSRNGFDSKDAKKFNQYTSDLLLRGGFYKTLNKELALGTNIITTNKVQAAETYLNLFSKYFNTKIVTSMDSDSNYGVNLYFYISRIKNWSTNFSYSKNIINSDFARNNNSYRPIGHYLMTENINVDYYLPKNIGTLSFSGYYYKNTPEDKEYSFGPKLALIFRVLNNLNVHTTLYAFKTSKAYNGNLMLSMNFDSDKVSFENSSYTNLKKYNENSTILKLRSGEKYNNNIMLNIQHNHKVNYGNVDYVSSDYKNKYGKIRGTYMLDKVAKQYVMDYSSIIAFNKDNFIYGTYDNYSSILLIKINGGNKKSFFDIYINNEKRASINGDSTVTVGVSPFKEYSIQLVSKGSNNVILDTNYIDGITIYPGEFQTFEINAKNTIILVGKLYSENDKILKDIDIIGEMDITSTDDNGEFQITVTDGEVLKIGKDMYFDTKNIDKKERVVFMDKIVASKNDKD